MKKKFLDKIFYFSIFLFIISGVIVFIFFYLKPTPATGLKLNLIGPNEVNSLENYSYNLIFENNSNQNLVEVSLKIFLSDGAFLVNRPQEKEVSIFIGEFSPKDTFSQNLDFFFINEGGLKENIKIILNYKIQDKPHIFEKEENFAILVKNPPLKIQVFVPEKTYLNYEFQAIFRIINLSSQKLNSLKFIIETPSYFKIISSFPQTEDYYFQYPFLKPLETKEISLIGQIQDIRSSGIFSAKAEFEFLNRKFSLTKEIVKINLLENPVAFYIKSDPASHNIPIGSNLYYEIIIENKGQSTLENNEVRVKLSGPFDLLSLNSDGYFSEIEQVLIWNSRNKPGLLNFKPKDRITLRFSISLFRSYPILGENNKNFSAKIRVEFRTATIPVEIETSRKEFVIFQEDEKKITGNITINQNLIYNDDVFPGTGPLPLIPGEPTTLAWHIRIKTIGEDFTDFSLNTKLPIGVNLTGKVGGDAILENLKFDPKTGIFVYSINNLKANLGYLEKELDLIFQIIVIPPINVDLNNYVIIPQIQYSAMGSFSKVQLQNNVPEIQGGYIIK